MPVTPSAVTPFVEKMAKRMDDMAEAAELEVGIRFKSVYCSPLSAAFGGLPSHGGAAELEVG